MPNATHPAGALLREVARLYTKAQRVVADCCGTTGTQGQLLIELGRSGPMPLAELGTRLCLEKSWVSRAVDSLQAEGWVTREPNPADARSWLVTPTAAGARRYRELETTLDNHAAKLLEPLSDAQRAQVERSLVLMLQALRAETDIAACCPRSIHPANPRTSSSCR